MNAVVVGERVHSRAGAKQRTFVPVAIGSLVIHRGSSHLVCLALSGKISNGQSSRERVQVRWLTLDSSLAGWLVKRAMLKKGEKKSRRRGKGKSKGAARQQTQY